jgi:large subunit ribosomal protein L15e
MKGPTESYFKEEIIKWRKEPSIKRMSKPTKIGKARRYGYKAKQGYVIVRVKVRRGGARKIRPKSGRRPKALGVTRFTRHISIKRIAQERACKRYPNLLPLNSYWIGEDGKHTWFEVVMIDPQNPVIKADKSINKLRSIKQ